LRITIPLKTHFAYTNNKFAANKFLKANGQLLYNQKLNRFSRNNFMHNMHSYIGEYLPELSIEDYPLIIDFTFYVVNNYQSVSRRNGEIRFPINLDVEPSFDIDNLATIWKKAILDSLQHREIITNDSAKYVRKLSEEVLFINEPEKMFIEIEIKKYEKKNTSLPSGITENTGV